MYVKIIYVYNPLYDKLRRRRKRMKWKKYEMKKLWIIKNEMQSFKLIQFPLHLVLLTWRNFQNKIKKWHALVFPNSRFISRVEIGILRDF